MNKQVLVDIGINLTHEQFRHDFDDVLNRAYDQHVLQMIVTGTSEHESVAAQRLCEKYDRLGKRLFSTAGVHPHDAQKWRSETSGVLKALLTHESVVAVGECGLDFNRDFSPRAAQEKVYAMQLELAVACQRPVFLHERDAFERFVGIMRDYRDHLSAGVVHCFTGSKKELYAYLDLDLHIGMTGWLADERRGKHLQELMKDIPANRLMIETDGPYLLPRTLKVKTRRNEPAFLTEVLRVVALYREEPVEVVAEQTTACARAFFNLPEPDCIKHEG